MMLKIFAVLLIIAPIFIEDTQEKKNSDKVIILDKSSRLVIEYRAKGTRGEGQNGRLYINDMEINGEMDEMKTINGITLKYYGSEMKTLWQITG